ncbi:MAG: hypothetical protein HYT80_04625 [Euryarchaeota archaeon]|nr:hypothetical protein [Euryarchaeota archaeon]
MLRRAGPFARAWWLPLGALLLVPLSANAQTGPDAATPGAEPVLDVPPEVGYLLALPEHLDDAAYLQAAVNAQLDHQGREPAGASPLAQRGLPPDATNRDMQITCDVTGDGTLDFLVNEFEGAGAATVKALSGSDGSELWRQDNQQYSYPATDEYKRAGRAPPLTPDNVQPTLDANGDGVCDVLTLGYRTDGTGTPVGSVSVLNLTGVIRLLDGKSGEEIWKRPIYADRVRAQLLRVIINIPIADVFVLRNLPTGFLPFDSPDGPRLVYKTTDVYYAMAQSPFNVFTRLRYETMANVEHVHVFDATTGKLLWRRDIEADQDSRWTDFTWITGAADLGGGDEPEVVLDQYRISNPRGTEVDARRIPLLNRTFPEPFYRFGRGMNMLALRGESGADAWSQEIFREGALRPNLPREEQYEILQWTHGEILEDVTGDGRPDPVALYLTREAGMTRTINGRFLTHVHLVDGANGREVFGERDVKFQGWGYVASLGSGADGVPRLGGGFVDLPTNALPIARFPQKDVRIVVIDARDGTTFWTYAERFAQDNYLSYALTLDQYAHALAPHDWDGDGIRDLLTPSQYRGPGQEQLLLSTMNHTYEVLSGLDGAVLHKVTAWGANGIVVNCHGDPDNLTILSGHGRRLDLTRIRVRDDATLWQERVWLDPTLPRAASAGFDLLFLAGRCAVDDEDRTVFAVNSAFISRQRGREFKPFLGLVDASGAVDWQTPELNAPSGVLDFIEEAATLAADDGDADLLAGVTLGPIIPGGLVGGALLFARPRRGVLSVAILVLLSAGIFMGAAGAAGPELPVVDPALADASPAGTREERLAERVDEPGATAFDVADAVREYFLAEKPPYQAAASMDENSTVSYSYPAGDIDGDGFGDIVLDTYCTDYGCQIFPGLGDPVAYAQYFLNGWICGPEHRLTAHSGRDGHELWNRSMQEFGESYPAGCAQHFVIGTLPLTAGHTGVLAYRHKVVDPAWPFEFVRRFSHTLYVVNASNPRDVVWEREYEGTYSTTYNFVEAEHTVADTILVNPILQVPPMSEHDPTWAAGQAPSLFLQGVGFDRVILNSTVAEPVVFNNNLQISKAQRPLEWATRLDPATGNVVWRTNTFQPETFRSLKPVAVRWGYYDIWFDTPYGKDKNYWSGTPCCFDLTGDAVPDLAYYTIEWHSFPMANTQGPFFRSSHLVVFDGATGARRYEANLLKDSRIDRTETIRFERAGDLNADGAPDLLVHILTPYADFTHTITARSGREGSELWRVENRKEMRLWPLGDANGDGAVDFLVLEWFAHPSYAGDISGPLTNVTVTPLRLWSGRDATTIWETETVMAPIDILAMHRQFELNGFPDLDGDGVGDFVTDDPLFLSDLSVIHRQTAVSGRDASKIFDYVVGGTFAFPFPLGDLDADGHDELGVLNGDIVDLWFTAYDGTNGSALWSRRAFAGRVTSYYGVQPLLQVHHVAGEAGYFANFHFGVVSRVWSDYTIYISTNGVDQGADVTIRSTYPSVTRVNGTSGGLAWSYPETFGAANVSKKGPTSASVVYAKALEEVTREPPLQLPAAAAVAIGAVSFVGSAASAFLMGRRLRP